MLAIFGQLDNATSLFKLPFFFIMFTFYEIQIDVCREKKITMICKQ